MKKLFSRCKNGIVRRYKEQCWKNDVRNAAKQERKLPIKEDVVIFDTSIHSLNMGDVIIQYYCKKIIEELFNEKEVIRIPTHIHPNSQELENIIGVKNKIVCGTNLMTPHYEEYSIWKMPDDLYGYSNIITLGVGWGYYCDDISRTSKYVYNIILNHQCMHSVRDRYTEKKFHEMGIHNVINTGCPTLWGLTKEKCEQIPCQKAQNVIATITDYDRDIKNDKLMLEILLEEYERVSVWIQGNSDFEYLNEIIDINRIEIIPHSFDAYTEILKRNDIDYVGTRLHAGIHALNYGVRSLIVAIDNRAIEMGKDFNLPVILRGNIETQLRTMIHEYRKTSITIPVVNIEQWKKQFEVK